MAQIKKIVLNGITWGHSWGITPLLATSQWYNELFHSIEINWQKRTLQEFADFPIEKLTEKYDLLIIDHPWCGTAAALKCVLPLNQYLSEDYLFNQLNHSVGYSHLSYYFKNEQWALAIDAATPVASYRKDLFEKENRTIPDTWEELIELAKEGRVIVPGIPVDLLMNFYSFCIAVGEEPFKDDKQVVSQEKGGEALWYMKQLWSLCSTNVFQLNPIETAELMTKTDTYWYCPFAYGYSNYSRKGYAASVLTYTDVISFKQYGRLKTTLGGTGLAISAGTKYKDECVAFAQWVNSELIQQTLYAEHSGQPGHRSAWQNKYLNQLTNNFFIETLPALDRAYVRPRYHGYLHFQDKAGEPLREYLINGGNEYEVIDSINNMYYQSLKIRDLK